MSPEEQQAADTWLSICIKTCIPVSGSIRVMQNAGSQSHDDHTDAEHEEDASEAEEEALPPPSAAKPQGRGFFAALSFGSSSTVANAPVAPAASDSKKKDSKPKSKVRSSPLSANSEPVVLSTWEQRDVEMSKLKKVSRQHMYVSGIDSFVSAGFATEEPSDLVCTSVSPSGMFIAKFFQNKAMAAGPGPTASGDGAKGWIEIWSPVKLMCSIDISSEHGAFYADEWFGGVGWSPSEMHIAYVAERKPQKTASYWAKVSTKDEKAVRRGSEYNRRNFFGEAYENLVQPSIFVADLNDATIQIVSDIPKWLAPGNPQFRSDETELFFHATVREHDQLGLRYCYNRRCGIYSIRVKYKDQEGAEVDVAAGEREEAGAKPVHEDHSDGSVDMEEDRDHLDHEVDDLAIGGLDLGDEDLGVQDLPDAITCWTANNAEDIDYCARCPRLHPTGRFLVYLSTPKTETNAHFSTSRLRLIDLISGKAQTLVDIPKESEIPNIFEDFPGIYATTLPRNIFINEECVAFDTVWGFWTVPMMQRIKYDLADQGVKRVGRPQSLVEGTEVDEACCSNIVDINNGYVLLAQSSPVAPPTLVVLDTMNSNACYRLRNWYKEEDPGFHDAMMWDSEVCIVAQNQKGTEYSTQGAEADQRRFQVMLVSPRTEEDAQASIPLLVFPHGGPHSSHAAQFNPGIAALVYSGFAVLMVNFRGSTGLGEFSLQSLPGKIGDQDVVECLAATEWALGFDPRLSRDHVGVIGGSHGGFLGAHLCGQRPSLFKAAVLRNPVVNISSMCGTTDIPDWCYAEIGVKQFSVAPTSDLIMRMLLKSPILHHEAVRAATLLQLGGNDHRVPPQQGLEWKRALQKNGVPCKVTWYPTSGHSLAESPTNEHSWVQAIAWFLKYLAVDLSDEQLEK